MIGWLLSRSRRMLRVTAYLFVVTVIALLVAARSGYGRVEGVALHLGEELSRLTETTLTDDHPRLRINGQLVNASSARVEKPYREVLDYYQDACKERADGLVHELAHLRGGFGEDPRALHGFPGVGVMRVEAEDHGVVLCFAQGARADHLTVFERLRKFAETGDLSAVGDLRYVFARATERGAHVVAVWTEGPFELEKMFPADGDAPGTDAEDISRPDGARRLLTAYREGFPYTVRLYETALPAADVLARYDRAMLASRWEALSPVGARLPSSRAYTRPGTDLFVTTGSHEDRTLVSIVEVRSR